MNTKADKIRYVFALAFLLLISCSKRKYIELPAMTENQLPSQDPDMKFNLCPKKENLPDKIKKIYQVQGNDTVNILEFDQNKNLTFKFYKQFEGDYWHDKFIFMIEANVYEGNKLSHTYYLHSNVGYELFKYKYDGENISQVKSYQLDNIKGVNINQYSFIKKLKDYQSCIAFADKLGIQSNGKSSYEVNRDFSDRQVKEYGKDGDNYTLYSLNNKNKIQKINYYAKGKKWEKNSKFFEYDRHGRISISYSMDGKDTLKYTKYQYLDKVTIVKKREFGYITTTKKYEDGKLTESDFKLEDSFNSGTEHYTLDHYGIPVKIVESNGDKSLLYTFKNYYEFYK
ncbi:MAG: hypothetical protein QM710_03250 [Flavobacterium sp.]